MSIRKLLTHLAVLALAQGCAERRAGSVHTGTTSDAAHQDDAALQDIVAPTDAPHDAGPDTAQPDVAADVEVPACCGPQAPCPAGWRCAGGDNGLGVCLPAPEPGRCWLDADCPAGHACKGAAACPCNVDCDPPYLGPGVCTPPPPACTPISPGWVQEVCDAKALVVWDGQKCVSTCLGCCGCEPFCDATFQDVMACEAACQPTTGCVTWDGACDDALPAAPWWARTAQGCVEVSTCVCGGCKGTFASQAACEASCP